MPCPKCGATSGDAWGQCDGDCPMPMSPHYSGTQPDLVVIDDASDMRPEELMGWFDEAPSPDLAEVDFAALEARVLGWDLGSYDHSAAFLAARQGGKSMHSIAQMGAYMLGLAHAEQGYDDRPYRGPSQTKRKPSGKDRSKVKASRKQSRSQRKKR